MAQIRIEIIFEGHFIQIVVLITVMTIMIRVIKRIWWKYDNGEHDGDNDDDDDDGWSFWKSIEITLNE